MLIDGATVDLEQENQRLQAELRAQTRSCAARAPASSPWATPSAAASSATCTTARRAASPVSPCIFGSPSARRRPDSELAEMLETAIGELYAGIEELRELARGIHPAVLTQRGLEPALQSLASRAPLPVDVRATLEERLPEAIETAAYFAVSEALANVVKHAGAGLVAVDVERRVRPAPDRRHRRRLRGRVRGRRLRPARARRPRRRARRARLRSTARPAPARTCASRSRSVSACGLTTASLAVGVSSPAGASCAEGERARDQRTAHPCRCRGAVRARALGARALGRRGARLRRRGG